MSKEAPKTNEIPCEEWVVERMRASGPGGQHMQKTESKVRVRRYFGASQEFSEEEKKKLREAFPKGYVESTSQRTRSQKKNEEIARGIVRARTEEAITPAPERVPTQVPRAEKARRLEEKKRVAARKEFRGPVRDW